MSFRNTAKQYGSVSKFLHWMIAFLVIVMLIAGYFMMDIPNDALRGTVVNIHKLAGITILALMLIRAMWALMNPKPDSPKSVSYFEHLLERVGHLFLYAIIIAQPVFGWVGSMAAGRVPHIGSYMLALPVIENKSLSKACFQIHNILAIVIIVTVSLHVLAALYHHFVRKDNVLKRMMPNF